MNNTTQFIMGNISFLKEPSLKVIGNTFITGNIHAKWIFSATDFIQWTLIFILCFAVLYLLYKDQKRSNKKNGTN